MKPNFALNLTQEGVSLYHRSARGAWIEVGSVDMSAGPDSDSVKEDLAFLRKTALGLVQGTGLFSKVVLPESVVSYLSVQASGSDVEKTAQIAADLEQRFGIPANELVFDWVDTAGVCQVAVAERVTLEEAELFAVENRLNPVAIVAAPEPGYFTGEPMFRKTDFAAQLLGPDTEVDRDDHPFFPTAPEAVPDPDHGDMAADSAPAAAEAPPDLEPERETAPTSEDQSSKPLDTIVPSTPGKAGATDDAGPDDAEKESLPVAAFATHRTDDAAADVAGDHPIDAIEPRFSAIPVAPDPAEMDLPAPGIGEDTGQAARKPFDPRGQAAAALAGSRARLSGLSRTGVAWLRRASGRTAGLAAGAVSAGAGIARILPTKRGANGDAQAATSPDHDPGGARESSRVDPVAGTQTGATPPEAARSAIPVMRRAVDRFTRTDKNRRLAGLAAAVLLLIAFGTGAAWYLTPPMSDPLGDIDPNDPAVLASQPASLGEQADSASADQGGSDAQASQTDPLQTTVEAGTDQRPRRRPDEIMPDTVAPITELTEEERAAILAAGLPLPDADVDEPELTQTQQQIDAIYEITGIQPNVVLPAPPGFDELGEDVFIPGQDPRFAGQDAVALPDYTRGSGDLEPPRQRNPIGPGIAFDFDENGFVRATASGALTPEGAVVFAGRPRIAPPTRPAPPEGTATGEQVTAEEPPNPLAGFRPRHRPTQADRDNATTFGSLTREQLARTRPRERPNSPQALAAAAIAAGESPYAVVVSTPPSHRPEGFSEAVQKLREEEQQRQAAAARRPQQQGNQNAPNLPTSANVAEQATIKNAINLGRLNLIGVYGSSSSRRALMRLPSGRYVKVEVGDRVDGGRIASISSNSVNYVKGGQAKVLKVPSGG